MDKLNQLYLNFSKISSIFFKIDIKDKNNEKEKEKEIQTEKEKYLENLKVEDLTLFLVNLGFYIQSYDINFLVNNNNDYFIKFEILIPSLNDLLNNKNHQCIFPNCNEIILNYRTNFCTEHLESPDINNIELINQYFELHSKELKQIFKDYKNQKNLSTFLKTKYNNIEPIVITYPSNNIPDVIYSFELTTDINKLIEIELSNEINELDCMIYTNFSESDSDSDSNFNFDSDEDILKENENENEQTQTQTPPNTPETNIISTIQKDNDKKDGDSDSDINYFSDNDDDDDSDINSEDLAELLKNLKKSLS